MRVLIVAWRAIRVMWACLTKTRELPWIPISITVIIGGGLAATPILLYYYLCVVLTNVCSDSSSDICCLVRDNPPWLLVTGLAIASPTILLWFWRDKHRRKDLRIAGTGQVTERFSRAIEHLGSGEMAVRLGGIYALEKIAKDNPDDYMATIIETLSAFVREESKKRDDEQELQDRKYQDLNADVMAALAVLGRLDNKTGTQADLTRANFNRALLSGVILKGAILDGANLMGAYLVEVDLTKASLRAAKLKKAILMEANLTKAKLRRANLMEANLKGAILTGAYLTRTILTGANLKGAILTGAILREPSLEGAMYDSGTVFPKGFDPVRAGMVLEGAGEEQT